MIVVLDIGKTNKKIILFDEQLVAVKKITAVFSEYEEGGIRYEQPEEILSWFLQNLKVLAAEYTITDISVTTHGASIVCLGEDDELALPPVAYTTDAGKEFDDDFYQRFGSSAELQVETATAPVGSLVNIAKLIYFLQQNYSDEYKSVEKILFYPQYFTYMLTGVALAEPTYLGCHTYLYDFEKKDYSRLVDELGIRNKLAPLTETCSVAGVLGSDISAATGINNECRVTVGIHDSNSSLLPHIIVNDEDFTLNSTGTWCVMMSRSGDGGLTQDEVGKTIFYNIDPFNIPVKTAIFMGGREYEVYSELIENCYGRIGLPPFDEVLYNKILLAGEYFFIPSVEVGVGIFPQSRPRVLTPTGEYALEELLSNEKQLRSVFQSYEEAYAALNCSLAAQTVIGMQYLSKGNKQQQIIIEGGFRKNIPYCRLLASYFAGTNVFVTSMEDATAVGAALQSRLSNNSSSMEELQKIINMERSRIEPVAGVDLQQYLDKFIDKID